MGNVHHKPNRSNSNNKTRGGSCSSRNSSRRLFTKRANIDRRESSSPTNNDVTSSMTERDPIIISDDIKPFPFFSEFHDDITINILSFVADAPLEVFSSSRALPEQTPMSSLTHIFPFVCKKFHAFSNLDVFWKDAVMRQLTNEPFLWKDGLERISGVKSNTNTVTPPPPSCMEDITAEEEVKPCENRRELMENAHAQLSRQRGIPSTECLPYKTLYQTVVSRHMRFKGPVFYMPGNFQLGDPYGLHFFEARYRLLMADVMQDQPPSAKAGGRVEGDGAYFIHANRSPLAPTSPALLVRVLRCNMYRDGRADVVLLPVAHVWIERLWVRPNSGHLYYAQSLKMGQVASHEMNRVARNEAVVHVMDRLTTEFVDELADGGEESAVGGGGGGATRNVRQNNYSSDDDSDESDDDVDDDYDMAEAERTFAH